MGPNHPRTMRSREERAQEARACGRRRVRAPPPGRRARGTGRHRAAAALIPGLDAGRPATAANGRQPSPCGQRARGDSCAMAQPEPRAPAMFVVGAAGFEPATTCAQGRCATRLRYAPFGYYRRPCRAASRGRKRSAAERQGKRSAAQRGARETQPAERQGKRTRRGPPVNAAAAVVSGRRPLFGRVRWIRRPRLAGLGG